MTSSEAPFVPSAPPIIIYSQPLNLVARHMDRCLSAVLGYNYGNKGKSRFAESIEEMAWTTQSIHATNVWCVTAVNGFL